MFPICRNFWRTDGSSLLKHGGSSGDTRITRLHYGAEVENVCLKLDSNREIPVVNRL